MLQSGFKSCPTATSPVCEASNRSKGFTTSPTWDSKLNRTAPTCDCIEPTCDCTSDLKEPTCDCMVLTCDCMVDCRASNRSNIKSTTEPALDPPDAIEALSSSSSRWRSLSVGD